MGIFSFFKKQFIDVIEWNESEGGVLAQRYEMQDREIQNGAQLTVRDTQLAVFVNEGVMADLFEPGMHVLATRNLPMLTNLRNWDMGFQSPFKSDMYFFSTREQLDQRWGTPNAITLRDKEFGPIRLRAHGTYSYRIRNPKVFFTKVSGTRDRFTIQEMEGQLRSMILTTLASSLGSSPVSFLDMAGSQLKFSSFLKDTLAPAFEPYGLKLESFFVQSVSLPDELQSHLDKVASIKMVGDLKTYAQFQSADAFSQIGKDGAGVASLGAGIAMSQMLNGQTTRSQRPDEDPVEQIKKLHELQKAGAITQAEFDAKKAELLGKIR